MFIDARVRQFERYYFAQIFAPQPDFASDWLLVLGESLRAPKFLISQRLAFARRLKRNYILIFLILLAAWVLKISTPNLQDQGPKGDFVHSVLEAINNANLGPIPGAMVVVLVALFYMSLMLVIFSAGDEDGELAHGDVHV